MNDYRNRVSPERPAVRVDYNYKSYLVQDISPGGVQVIMTANGSKQGTYTRLGGRWVRTDSGKLDEIPDAGDSLNIILSEVVKVAWGTQIK